MKKEIPILFSTPMVQAILAGNKTQTRRLIKPQPSTTGVNAFNAGEHPQMKCPYGQPGDLLWTRETFRKVQNYGVDYPIFQYKDLQYSEAWCNGSSREIFTEQSIFGKWKPSIHMPKAAARIWLEVVSVRVERLNNITEDDAKREGVLQENGMVHGLRFYHYALKHFCFDLAKYSFKTLWNSINGEDAWELNPWVWVIEFKKVTK